MSYYGDDSPGWLYDTIQRLSDAEEVVDFVPVGPRDMPDDPDFIAVKLAHGYESEVLDDILGYESYIILSATVGESGELMVDIIDPTTLEKFYHNLFL